MSTTPALTFACTPSKITERSDVYPIAIPEEAPVRFPAYCRAGSYPSNLAGCALNAKIVAERLEGFARSPPMQPQLPVCLPRKCKAR
jgi:hypothetical protein